MRRLIIAAITALTLGLTTMPAVADPGDTATATFSSKRVVGQTTFVEGLARALTTTGTYSSLNPKLGTIFTVAYPNRNCSPKEALPIGPVAILAAGTAVLPPFVVTNATYPQTGRPVDVGDIRSISVRRGDNATDIDGDGLVGTGDVVASVANPKLGRLACYRVP